MDGQILQDQPFEVKKTFLQKFFHHKTAFISASIGLLLLIGMGTYVLLSPSRKTLVMPATQENLLPLKPSATKTPTPTAEPTNSPTPTPAITSWKTYTNSTYKYNIKYPSDWVARDLGVLEAKIPSYIVFNTTSASSSARHITVSVTTRTYEEQLALSASGSAVTYAGIKGTKQSFKDSDGNTSTVIILPRTNNLLVLRAKTAYLTIFNLMLTTLKITN